MMKRMKVNNCMNELSGLTQISYIQRPQTILNSSTQTIEKPRVEGTKEEPQNKTNKKPPKPNDSDNDADSSASFERIKALFRKTEEMKEIAKEKNKDVENQFESLRERLNSSTTFLNQMKSSIENLRFSYQRKMMEQQEEDYEDYLKNKEKFKNKEEMNGYLEELKGKIETLQTKPKNPVLDDDGPQDYQSALKDVVNNLKIIDEGLYSSTRNFGKEKK